MDAITALHSRTAAPRLLAPCPSEAELEQVFQAALRAPDHAMLRPWHFLVVKGGARSRLGRLFVECLAPDAEEKAGKLLQAPLRAPLIIIAAAAIQDHPKVPAVEQISSTAAAVQNMSVALHALGYASIWRTGPPAYSDKLKEALGFRAEDAIVGFLYVGTPSVAVRPPPRHETADYFQTWE